MAPLPKKKKVISVTYVPDRTKAVAIGKRFTLKKRQTTIRPITFDISVAGSDSPTPVSKDSNRDVPDSQPDVTTHDKHTLNGLSQLSVADGQMVRQNVEATSPLVYVKDHAAGNQHQNSDQMQETSGHQSPMVDAQCQSVAAEFLSVKSGHQATRHQSSTQKTPRYQSETKMAGHHSANFKTGPQSRTFEAGHQSLSVNIGSQAVGHQSSTIKAIGQSPTFEVGHKSRAAEAGSQTVSHRTAGHNSVPEDREDQIVHHGLLTHNSVLQTSTNFLTGAQLGQTAGSHLTQESTRLQSAGEQGNVDYDAGTQSNPASDAEHSAFPEQSHHYLRSSRHLEKSEAQSNVKSTSKGTGVDTSNVTNDRVTSSTLHMIQTFSDKTNTGFKFAAPCTEKDVAMYKDRNAKTFPIPSDSNLSDIFRAPLPVKDSIVSRLTSSAQTPCDTPMRLPNISSIPVVSTSQSFDIVPENGQPSGLHLCPGGATTTKRLERKQRQLQPTTNSQLLQDLVIRVKHRSPSSSDENHRGVRPTMSNLSELTVLMSAMEDMIEQFICDSQPNAGIKRFLRDVTEDAFAKLRGVSRASHNISKQSKRLRASRTELRRKRKELLLLQQEHNRLEAEVAAAKISAGRVDEANRNKINDYLMKLSCLTSEKVL